MICGSLLMTTVRNSDVAPFPLSPRLTRAAVLAGLPGPLPPPPLGMPPGPPPFLMPPRPPGLPPPPPPGFLGAVHYPSQDPSRMGALAGPSQQGRG